MDLRGLRTLVAVIDAGSFSVAARGLGYTQSAVSQQVAALEHDLGAVLVTRRPVAPTPAGALLVGQARELLARADAAASQVRRVATSEDVRPPRLMISPGAEDLGLVLPDGLESVTSVPAHVAVARLAVGETDLALVDGITAPKDRLRLERPAHTTARIIADRAPAVLVPAGHPIAERPAIELADVAAARWIDAPHAALPLAELEAAGRTALRRGMRYDGTSRETVLALVASDAGLAAVPRGISADGPTGNLRAVPLGAPQLTHRIELWHYTVDRNPVIAAAAAISMHARGQPE